MTSETVRQTGHRVALAQVTSAPIDVATHEQAVAHSSVGAVVGFAGIVRDHDHGRAVTELEYTGHPSAADVLAAIAAEFAAREGVEAVAVSHRIGPLEIGDTALACAVGTAHRADAFALCAEFVDAVKDRIPIWKRQVFGDGTDEWVACP
jgi:molybdopterin synthase catalytic subunit